MSTNPVNGYFKQLDDYYAATTQAAQRTGQPTSATQAPDGGSATDSVSLSSDSVALTRPVAPPNAYCYLDTLTSSDRALVLAATGWNIDADPLGKTASAAAQQLVGRLNLNRSSGALGTGPLSLSYITTVQDSVHKAVLDNISPSF
jgi:hypothetical protein